MLALISPAKTLDFDTPAHTKVHSKGQFLSEAQALIEQLKPLSPQDISSLMKISDPLGQLNFARFHSFKQPFTAKNSKPALLAFKGDVYTGLDAESLSEADFEFAQEHLNILSGLYGLLKPLDRIQPYRLEMGTRFANSEGKDLYAFWGNKITDALNQTLAKHQQPVLINLASNEYFKAVNKKHLKADIITPVFKDQKNGQYKIISFYAKKARGMMAAYIIQNRLNDPEQLKSFNVAGYSYNESMSTQKDWVFTRAEQ